MGGDNDYDPDLSFKLVNSFFPNECKRTKDFPCVLANCLYADRCVHECENGRACARGRGR